MTHTMRLNPTPFYLISNGTKTIELRLNDEKRKKINVGDNIEFINVDDFNQKINVRVLKLHYYKNFEELYKALPLDKCGYSLLEINNASHTDMEKYYSIPEQNRYGVVGIEITILDN